MAAGRHAWLAKLEMTRIAGWWRGRPAAIRFAIVAALLMAAFYSVLYYPYGASSFPGRLLSGYLTAVARVSGTCVAPFDRNVRVEGAFITGRQSLQIVLDCAALDALALFGATVLAFPASTRAKALGIAVGFAVISAFNVLRIVLLYLAGMKSPELFDLLHEDVMALVIVLVSVGCFAAWAVLARNHSARLVARASPVC